MALSEPQKASVGSKEPEESEEREKTAKESNESSFQPPVAAETFEPGEAEATIYKLSLIILDKYSRDLLSPQETAYIRRIFGDEIMNSVNVYSLIIEEIREDCSQLLSLLQEDVHASTYLIAQATVRRAAAL